MSSDSQLAANRANAQHSTGPVSPAGLSAIRSNALKHGFYSNTAVLKGFESNDDFAALHADFSDHFAPAGPVELELASRIVLALWQLRRLQLAETQALQFDLIHAKETVPKRFTGCEPYILGYAFQRDIECHTSVLEGFARHRVRWDRTYYRALHELERIQLVRRGHAVPPPQILEIHAPDNALPASSVLQPPVSEPPVSEPRPRDGAATERSGCAVTAPPVSEPGPSTSAGPSTPASPSQPTPTHSSQKTNPQIGFVSPKSPSDPPPARPASPRMR